MQEKLKKWIWQYRRYGYAFFILILILGIYLWTARKEKPKANEIILEEKIEQKEEKQDEIKVIRVDIKGAVKNPGVYEMKENTRVSDVIFEAGGILENADTSRLNLSKKLVDEMVIIIYTKKEIESLNQEKKIEYIYVEPTCECPDPINDACIYEKSENKKISINEASLEELQTLPGIGEGKAKDIIAYRETHAFINIEEMKEVKGIGESVFNKIKDFITI